MKLLMRRQMIVNAEAQLAQASSLTIGKQQSGSLSTFEA